MAIAYEHIIASRTTKCDINQGNMMLAERLIDAGKDVSFSHFGTDHGN